VALPRVDVTDPQPIAVTIVFTRLGLDLTKRGAVVGLAGARPSRAITVVDARIEAGSHAFDRMALVRRKEALAVLVALTPPELANALVARPVVRILLRGTQD
jgi:hypothetical protein